MAIYNIFEGNEKIEEELGDSFEQGDLFEKFQDSSGDASPKDRLFSTILARLLFFSLLVADIAWLGFNLIKVCALLILWPVMKIFRVSMEPKLTRAYLNFKRSLVCAIALIVALFSPALGIMFSCSYFLMFDRKGIDEVVPNILRAQFKEFFAPIS